MNSTKKCNGAMNNSKNKMNSKISWLFNLKPNAHQGSVWDLLILLKPKTFCKSTVNKGKNYLK